MTSEQAYIERLKELDREMELAKSHLNVTKQMADRQITEARNEFERLKREAKGQIAEAYKMLESVRNRRRNFVRYHNQREEST